MASGTVVGLHRIPIRRAAPEPLAEAIFRADFGVEGDHHARAGRSRQVVVAEGEVLDELDLPPGSIREQLTVTGAGRLGAGVVVEIGTVRLEIVTPRVPCHVMETVRPGLERELRGRGGWCARVVVGGVVKIGDAVRTSKGDDPTWLTDYLVAIAEWEAVPPEQRAFEPGWHFREQFSHLIAWDERGTTRIAAAAAGESQEPLGDNDAFNAAAVARLADADLWELRDKWSTALVNAARLHPDHAKPWVTALARHYREHSTARGPGDARDDAAPRDAAQPERTGA
jgi:MOSC domain-containing protein YiiM